jgi:hypothetical protein
MRKSVTVLWASVALLLWCGSACAEDVLQKQGDPGFPSAPKRSVSEFLTPDGRFDLAAARKSGYQGPLDIAHFTPDLDPLTGEPVFRPSAPASPADHPDDIYWDNSISPSISGVDGEVYATTVYNGKLIVGGCFAVAGDIIANNIAAWDGTDWSALGSGTNDCVYTLIVYSNQLVAGGRFDTAGGVSASQIAAWDGSSWLPLSSGMNGQVRALAIYDNKLIAGGEFATAGDVWTNRIAAWDGSSWTPMGSGMNGYVIALNVHDSRLIAGGGFTMAGGVAANRIAAWDG